MTCSSASAFAPDDALAVAEAFLLTNNPARWEIDPEYMTGWVEATASGHGVEGRWSTGSTTKKIQMGDRAFLLRQGLVGRGIFASGTFISNVFQSDHWDGDGGIANYADVMWETALEPEDALPIATLFSELPDGQWEPQASGSQINPRCSSAWRNSGPTTCRRSETRRLLRPLPGAS